MLTGREGHQGLWVVTSPEPHGLETWGVCWRGTVSQGGQGTVLPSRQRMQGAVSLALSPKQRTVYAEPKEMEVCPEDHDQLMRTFSVIGQRKACKQVPGGQLGRAGRAHASL